MFNEALAIMSILYTVLYYIVTDPKPRKKSIPAHTPLKLSYSETYRRNL